MHVKVEIGQAVIFSDEHGVEHDALVTQNWGNPGFDADRPFQHDSDPAKTNWPPAINIVYIAKDERKDQYGKQTVHESSVAFKATTTAPGRYWRFK